MSNKVKFIALSVVLVLLGLLGFDMKRLADANSFWGMRPMFFLLSMTALITLLRSRFFYGDGWRVRWTVLSTFSAFLLYLGFPTMPFLPLIFIAFVPLLMVEHEISRFAERPFWKIALYSYHTFLVWNILSTYWVSNSTLGGGIFANFVNAALMTIPFMLYSFCKRHIKSSLHAWAFIGFWIAYEKLDQYWELTWTWLTLGNALAEYPSWAQWYAMTGVFGGTFWILLLNFVVFQIIKKHKIWGLQLKRLSIPIALFLVPILISQVIYFTYSDHGPTKKVLVVQPNFEPHYQKFNIPLHTQIQKVLGQIESKLDEDTEYILLPETLIRGVDIDNGIQHKYIRQFRALIAPYPNVKVVSGAGAYFRTQDALDIADRSRRTYQDRATGQAYYVESYNSAIQFSAESDSLQIYKKSILVPGTEIFPYAKYFPFMKGLVESMGGTIAGNGTQAQRIAFWDEEHQYAVAPVICYESIYGEYCTEYIRDGANAIFILTNDGWWDDSPGFRQHLKFASLRAIETRRSIARAANTGASAYINQRGDILEATDYEVDAVLHSAIAFNDHITFYTRWGDLIARISTFLSILLFLNAFVLKFTPKK
jgi:apolipoprotein N-acyltransferase